VIIKWWDLSEVAGFLKFAKMMPLRFWGYCLNLDQRFQQKTDLLKPIIMKKRTGTIHFIQKITARLYFLVIIVSGIAACNGKTGNKTKSGSRWEKGTVLSTYTGGGMVPESETVIIKDSAGIYIHWHMPATDSVKFALTTTDLDSLMGLIEKSGFLAMQSGQTEDIAYDKPSTSISLKNGGKSLNISDGAAEKIIKGSESEFFSLFTYINLLAKKKAGLSSE
jgi:hypothetical protein